MRDRYMIFFVVVVSALAAGGSALFAATRAADEVGAPAIEANALDEGAPPVAKSGAQVFEARCQRCHTLAAVVDLTRAQPAEKQRPWLTDLVARHYPPPKAEQPALVDFVLDAVARAK